MEEMEKIEKDNEFVPKETDMARLSLEEAAAHITNTALRALRLGAGERQKIAGMLRIIAVLAQEMSNITGLAKQENDSDKGCEFLNKK